MFFFYDQVCQGLWMSPIHPLRFDHVDKLYPLSSDSTQNVVSNPTYFNRLISRRRSVSLTIITPLGFHKYIKLFHCVSYSWTQILSSMQINCKSELVSKYTLSHYSIKRRRSRVMISVFSFAVQLRMILWHEITNLANWCFKRWIMRIKRVWTARKTWRSMRFLAHQKKLFLNPTVHF